MSRHYDIVDRSLTIKDQIMNNYYLKSAVLCGFALLGTVLTLSSCSDSEEVMNLEELKTSNLVPVSVHVSEFSFSMEELPGTRSAVAPGSYNYFDGEITLAFYDGDTEVYTDTQLESDASTYTTFGDFICELPVGTYTMVVVCRDVGDDDVFTLTSPTLAGYSSERVRETFAATQNVTVTGTSALNIPVTLNRVITLLTINSTDVRPEGVSKIRTTYGAGGKSFNPSTGLATTNTGFSLTNTPSAVVGQVIGVRNYAFLATDEQTMDITLEVLGANDQVIISKTIPNVPFKRNRQTKLTGPVFTPSATTASFTLETSWISTYEFSF